MKIKIKSFLPKGKINWLHATLAVLVIVSCMLLSSSLTRIAQTAVLPGEVIFHSVTVLSQAGAERTVRIGDPIQVLADISILGGCGGDPTGLIDWHQYGGGTSDGMSNCTDHATEADRCTIEFNLGGVSTPETGAIDVVAGDAATQVTVTVNEISSTGSSVITYEGTPVGVDNIVPTLSGERLSIDTTACTGTEGTCKINDHIQFYWDNTILGDNNLDISAGGTVIADLSDFGGSADQAMTDGGAGMYVYDMTVSLGDIDGSVSGYSVTVTDDAGNTAGPVVIENSVSIDNIAPTFRESDPVNVLLQNGMSASNNTNVWYYYALGVLEIPDTIIANAFLNDSDISAVRLCTKAMSAGEGCANSAEYEDVLTSVPFALEPIDLPTWKTAGYVITVEAPGTYELGLWAKDDAGNTSLDAAAPAPVLVAAVEINPVNFPELNNEITTDWSTIVDFTTVTNLVFSSWVEGQEIGRITLYGPLDLTNTDTIAGLLNFEENVTISGDVIRIDSEALAVFNGGAEVRMKVVADGQPGLIVKNNAGEILGYIGTDASEPVVIGRHTVGNFSWDSETQILTFTTDGFSEFDTDVTAPEVLYGQISGSNTAKIVYSEAVVGLITDYSNLMIDGEVIARNITGYDGDGTDTITLTFDGDPVSTGGAGIININSPPARTVEDLVGNELPEVIGQVLAAVPADVYVDDDWTGTDNAGGHTWQYDAFDVIQDGIDNVASGGTVHVAAGTYGEYLNVIQPMTIEGDTSKGEGQTAGPGVDAPVLSMESCGNMVSIYASNVIFRGFQVVSGCSRESNIILAAEGEVTSTTISDNEIVGNSYGVHLLENSNTSSVLNNLIRDASNGIAINASIANTISGNEIYDNSTGISLGKQGCSGDCLNPVDGNTIENNNMYSNLGFGIRAHTNASALMTPVSINSNTISASCEGIYIDSNVTGLSITRNNITSNTDCIKTGVHNRSDGQIRIRQNSITSNITGATNAGEGTLDGTRNYWGAASGPTHETINPSGTGDAISDNIDYWPHYIDAAITMFALEPDHIQLPLENGDDPIKLNVPTTVNNGSLDVSTLMGDGLSVTLPSIEINSETSVGQVGVAIPNGTLVTGEGRWNGTIHVPIVKPNDSVVVTGGIVTEVIELGFDDTPLAFDQGVRIRLAGKAGSNIGYSRGGIFTEITSICASDSQATGDRLSAGAECKIDVAGDLVVWTKHFTLFATFGSAAGGGGTGGGTTGGGGGTGSAGSSSISGAGVYGHPSCSGVDCDRYSPGSYRVSGEGDKGGTGTPNKIIAPQVVKFIDIDGHWAEYYIKQLAEKGAAIGLTKNIFGPDYAITRNDLVKMVVLAFHLPISTKSFERPLFKDVLETNKDVGYLRAAKEAGVISGYGDGYFRPTQQVNRVEALKIILKAAKFNIGAISNGQWYAGYVRYSLANGITGLNKSFRPDSSVSRAEAAKMVIMAILLQDRLIESNSQ